MGMEKILLQPVNLQQKGAKQRSLMTAKGKLWWDPYETSNRRQFVYRPNSATQILLCQSPTSTSFKDSHSLSGPFGSTAYRKDFSWKPACKPESIRTGTASGQRGNNPHPSQSFLMWRLPREATQGSDYVSFPWKCPPSEGVIRKALTAQYCSTYRCDFQGMPQVPAVAQLNVNMQKKSNSLTDYDRFCGKRLADASGVLKSLTEKEKEAVRTYLSKDVHKNSGETKRRLPAVVRNSCTPERISSWPGPQ